MEFMARAVFVASVLERGEVGRASFDQSVIRGSRAVTGLHVAKHRHTPGATYYGGYTHSCGVFQSICAAYLLDFKNGCSVL